MNKQVKVEAKNETTVSKSNKNMGGITMSKKAEKVNVVETVGTGKPEETVKVVAGASSVKDNSDKSSSSVKKEEDARLEQLTDQYVGKLGTAATKELSSWITLGKIIDEFVKKVSPNGGKAKFDPYVRLARHPSSVHQPGQLRNLHGSCLLIQDFGGEEASPRLPLTHYIVVLGKSLTIEKKRQLLQSAVDEKLTVTQLKAKAFAMRLNNNTVADPVAKQWDMTKLTARTKSLFDVLVGINKKITDASPMPEEVRINVQKALKPIVDFAIAYGYLSNDNITHPEIANVKDLPDGDLFDAEANIAQETQKVA